MSSRENLEVEFKLIQKAVSERWILREEKEMESERCCIVFSEKEIRRSIENLKNSFPPNSKHCYALKANGLEGVLKIVQEYGLGVECASFEECLYSLDVNFQPSEVVFDSPCKTQFEIDQCLKKDIFFLNIDNLDELERVKISKKKYPNSKTIVGLRINPQLEKTLGQVEHLATATKHAKFGIPLQEIGFEFLFERIKELEWVKGVHMHGGEGSIDAEKHLKMITKGVSLIVKFADYVNEKLGEDRMKYVNIGGGFPTALTMDEEQIGYETFWNLHLKEVIDPKRYIVITEYGMSTVQRSAFILSRIEYVKYNGGHQIAILHCGSNLFAEVGIGGFELVPNFEKYLEADGKLKQIELLEDGGKTTQLDLCGPLCWSGDMLTPTSGIHVRKPIKNLKSDDIVVFPSSGAYTFSEYCKANSRRFPSVYLLKENGTFVCIKKVESFKKCIDFWKDE